MPISSVVFVLIGYLLGSLPFGLIIGHLSTGVDVRKHGSGSTGMTNVLRTIGRPAAAIVLLLDMGKAILAVTMTKFLIDSPEIYPIVGLATIAGHNWPIFTRFKGGKGTAAGWGALIALSPLAGLVAGIVGLTLIAVLRYVSVGSIISSVSGGLALIVLSINGSEPLAYSWYGAIGPLLILFRHRDNIGRLSRGEEHKLGKPFEKYSKEKKTDPVRLKR